MSNSYFLLHTSLYFPCGQGSGAGEWGRESRQCVLCVYRSGWRRLLEETDKGMLCFLLPELTKETPALLSEGNRAFSTQYLRLCYIILVTQGLSSLFRSSPSVAVFSAWTVLPNGSPFPPFSPLPNPCWPRANSIPFRICFTSLHCHL